MGTVLDMVTVTAIGPEATVVAGVGRCLLPLVAYWFTKLLGSPSTFSPIQWSFSSNRFTPRKPIPLAPPGLKCKAQTAASAELAPAPNKASKALWAGL